MTEQTPASQSTASAEAVAAIIGRPTLYRDDYVEDVKTFCVNGFSLTAFAGKIGISRRTLSYWREVHPEFDDACEVAKARACLWYEAQSRKVARGEGGPGAATLVMFALKNLGAEDFSDRRQVEHLGQVSHRHLTYEQAVEEARRRGLPMHVLEEGGAYLADEPAREFCELEVEAAEFEP